MKHHPRSSLLTLELPSKSICVSTEFRDHCTSYCKYLFKINTLLANSLFTRWHLLFSGSGGGTLLGAFAGVGVLCLVFLLYINKRWWWNAVGGISCCDESCNPISTRHATSTPAPSVTLPSRKQKIGTSITYVIQQVIQLRPRWCLRSYCWAHLVVASSSLPASSHRRELSALAKYREHVQAFIQVLRWGHIVPASSSVQFSFFTFSS